jgi:hypothetical protein
LKQTVKRKAVKTGSNALLKNLLRISKNGYGRGSLQNNVWFMDAGEVALSKAKYGLMVM